MERLPTYQELKNRLSLTEPQSSFVAQSRQAIRQILSGQDPRLLLIVGPCSIHDITSAKEFATYLRALASEVSEQFFVVMRVYCEKPRTTAGWKGFLYDPFLDGSNDMIHGIQWTRQLFRDLADMQIPTATEFLDPLTAWYYEDLVSWGSIGARTSSSQTHRQFASGLKMPIGFKNGLAGNLSAAVNGIISARQSHTYMGLHETGQPVLIRTKGNEDAHLVLRGGEPAGPNYEAPAVAECLKRLEHAQLPQCVIIDCSHHNSGKKFDRQPIVFQSVLQQIRNGNHKIRGLMLESHLQAGNQTLLAGPSHLKYGLSVTDSCLDWMSTKTLIQWGAETLQNAYLHSEAML